MKPAQRTSFRRWRDQMSGWFNWSFSRITRSNAAIFTLWSSVYVKYIIHSTLESLHVHLFTEGWTKRRSLVCTDKMKLQLATSWSLISVLTQCLKGNQWSTKCGTIMFLMSAVASFFLCLFDCNSFRFFLLNSTLKPLKLHEQVSGVAAAK